MDIKLNPIGFIKTVYKSRRECPHQADPNSPPAELIIKEEFLDCIKGLSKGDELIVLTWLHLAKRDVLQCYPKRDRTKPLTGVFATRSPDRPNPIGYHVVKLLEVRKNVLIIHPIEVVDGTFVVDIKPYRRDELKIIQEPLYKEWELFREIGYRAWQKGLLAGFGGNISIRKDDGMIITRSGISKGDLKPQDIGFIGFDDDFKQKGFSIESLLHATIYKKQPKAKAILHTHPPYLLSISIFCEDNLLDTFIYEAEIFKDMLSIVPPLEPGSRELAFEVSEKATNYKAIFMKRHGLVCWEEDLRKALTLSEEIENIAKIKYLTELYKFKGGLE